MTKMTNKKTKNSTSTNNESNHLTNNEPNKKIKHDHSIFHLNTNSFFKFPQVTEAAEKRKSDEPRTF